MGGPRLEQSERLDALLRDVGRRIAEIRRRRRLTQAELAVRLPMHVAQLKRLEQGRANVTLGTLDRVAAFFGVHVRSLLRASKRKG
jgi:transcriptional regulator with XRE-family HTH domain